jgi:hypothetical protein
VKRYTSEELAAMRRRGEDQTDWERVESVTDDEVERLVAEDPDERDID